MNHSEILKSAYADLSVARQSIRFKRRQKARKQLQIAKAVRGWADVSIGESGESGIDKLIPSK